MKLLPLTKGYFTKVDDEDFETLSKRRWSASWAIGSKNVYAVGTLKNKKCYLHRVILGVTDRLVWVDHINGDSLDNRRENLRICSPAENCRNKAINKKRKIPFKGLAIS